MTQAQQYNVPAGYRLTTQLVVRGLDLAQPTVYSVKGPVMPAEWSTKTAGRFRAQAKFGFANRSFVTRGSKVFVGPVSEVVS